MALQGARLGSRPTGGQMHRGSSPFQLPCYSPPSFQEPSDSKSAWSCSRKPFQGTALSGAGQLATLIKIYAELLPFALPVLDSCPVSASSHSSSETAAESCPRAVFAPHTPRRSVRSIQLERIAQERAATLPEGQQRLLWVSTSTSESLARVTC